MKEKSFLKILFLSFYLFCIIIIIFTISLFVLNKKSFYKNLNISTNFYKESQIALIKTEVDKTLKIIQNFYKNSNSISKDFFKNLINYKFGENKNLYIFIMNFDGKMLAHPIKSELINQNLYNLKDSRGKFFVREIINIAKKNKNGFVEYYWETPSNKKISNKLTYINSDRNLNLIVCSGIYIDDIISEYHNTFAKLKFIYNQKIYLIIFFLIIMITLFFIVFNKIIIRFKHDFDIVKNHLSLDTLSNKKIDISKFSFEEIKKISNFLNTYISQLKKNIYFLEYLFEHIPVPLFLKSDTQNIVDCNHAFEKLYGYKKEELINKSIKKIVPSDVLEKVKNTVKKEYLKDIYTFETENIKKDGSRFPCLVNTTNIKINNKKYTLIGINDLTQQKNYEQKLKLEKEKFQKYFDIANIMIGVIDNNGTVQMVNRKVCEVLGYNKEEIIGKNWHDNFLPEDIKEKAKINFFKEIKNPKDEITSFEGYVVTSKKEKRLIRWTYTYIKDNNGKVLGEFATGEDVTDIKKLEAQIQKHKNFESIGILAGGIAHDFNNILTGIIANLSLLKMEKSINRNQIEIINDIEKASKKALNLSTQLLTFSKGGEPITKPESITDIIKETINFYTSGTKIKINLKAPPNLWNVKVDKNQISQVFTNLILNSKQAISKEGNIYITLKNKRFLKDHIYVKNKILKSGNYVQIILKDNGKGIPKDILPKIFNPYFTTKKNGSGLGLSIVYSILKKHKGHIEVTSKLNRGTTFTIYLKATSKKINKPLKIHTESENDLKIKKRFSNNNLTILILEDDEIVQNTFKSILLKTGYSFYITDKSNELVKKYKELIKKNIKIKTIILDLTIKGSAGGIETAKKLLKINKNLNLIVTTGYYNSNVLNNLEKYGFKYFLKKPFSAYQLIEILDRI